jgi:uncharacterized protein (TIGR02444 family)
MGAPEDCWAFAERFYAVPGVSAACLTLQDRHGADVCIVLYLLYLATTSRSLPDRIVAQVDESAKKWREAVVIPLRNVRNGLRQPRVGYPGRDSLRRLVLDAEVEAEHMQLLYLAALPVAPQRAVTHRAAAIGSLSGYAVLLGRRDDDIMTGLLALFDAYCAANSGIIRKE